MRLRPALGGPPSLLRLAAPLGVLAALLALAACDSGGIVQNPDAIDYQRLFTAPTPAEVQDVEEEWASRLNPVRDARIEDSLVTADSTALYVVSHTQADAGGGTFTHYGLVRIPTSGQREPLPVLVYHHAGDDGFAVSDILATLDRYPTLKTETVQVVPVYRSETLRADTAGLGGEYTAGGTPSLWDRDVDDAIGLLNVALALFADETDEARVGALGFDRGGNTALLHALRDDSVDVVVEYFAPSDFFDASARAVLSAAADGNAEALAVTGVQYLLDTVLEPLAAEDLSYEEARLELLRRSPGFFAGRLPHTQVHHHRRDPVVPLSFSEAFASRVVSNPVDGDFDFNTYTNSLPGGVDTFHDIDAMPQSLAATEVFIGRRLTEEETTR